jgi:ferric-dicitrate binding protein FerR (iron transport regulator)
LLYCCYQTFTRALTVILAVGTLLLVCSASKVLAQATAGSVSAVSGDVRIQRAGATTPATFGAQVQVGDRIITGADGRVTITLKDQSQMELEESSNLVIDENLLTPSGTRASTKVTLFGGLLHSLVNVTPGTPPNYEVHTPNAVASARGTKYDVLYQQDVTRKEYKNCRNFTDVSVYGGTVEVGNSLNPTTPPVEVETGHKTTVPCAYAPTGPVTIGGISPWIGTGLGLAIVTGGVVGGLAATGEFGGNSNNNHPVSPSE